MPFGPRLAILLFTLLGLSLTSAGTPLQAQAPGAAAASATASRDQLAAGLLRLEYALRDRPPAAAAMPDVNRAFDRLSLQFFAGRFAEAVLALDSLTMAVEPDSTVRASQRAVAARALATTSAQTRTLTIGSSAPIPYRVHAPAGRAPGVRLPLIVALHGAGGDENMFLEAYGAGAIRGLADARGFIVATPLTMPMLRAPDALARLIDTVAAELPVDRARVYLLGHSLGAAAAWNLARLRPDLVAAVVCIAGVCGSVPAPAPPRVPPLLSVVGELDPIAQPARVEAMAAEARAAGRAAEFRVIPGYGHTLVVGAVLPDVIDWLLRQPALSLPRN